MKIQALHKKGVWLHILGEFFYLKTFTEKTVVTQVKRGKKVLSETIEQVPAENPFAILIDPSLIIAIRAAGEEITDADRAGLTGVYGHIYSPEKGHFRDELEKDGGTFLLVDGKKTPFTLEPGFTNVDEDGKVKVSTKTGKPLTPRGKFGTPAGEGIPVVWDGVESKFALTITQRPPYPSNGLNVFSTLYPKAPKSERVQRMRDDSSLIKLDSISNLFAEVSQ